MRKKIRKSINQSKALKIGQDINKAKVKDDYFGEVIQRRDSLLNNSNVWIELGKTSIDKLNTLQNTMFRYLFAVPDGTPIPLLRFDPG